METILSVHDLCIQYEMQDGIVKALNGVDFELEEGSSHGLVGETGAGKTTMAKGIMGLTPKPYGKIKSGEILYHGKDLLKMGTKELRKIRGEHISMIFQDPMTSLNPVITVGDQIAEAVETHQKCSRRQAEQRVREILELVGIAPERATDYTKALLSAIPVPDPDAPMNRTVLKGEITSPINVKPGCRFAKRCIYATEECTRCSPEEREVSPGHFVACHQVKD